MLGLRMETTYLKATSLLGCLLDMTMNLSLRKIWLKRLECYPLTFEKFYLSKSIFDA
jgi:hypothetical protein